MDDATSSWRSRLPRVRRSTRLWILLAAVLGAVGLVIAMLSVGPGTPVGTRPPAPLPAPGQSPCTTSPTDPEADRLAHTFAAVDRGAASVWLCTTNDLGPIVPGDALRSRVDDLAALINSLPELPPNASCTAELGPHFALLFYYPDGTRLVVAGQLDGCRVIAGRRGAQQVIDTFLAWLLDQRRAEPAPAVTAALTRP